MNLVTGYSGSAHIKSSDVASIAKGLLGDGLVVLNRGDCFSHTIISNNKIRIGSGDLVYQGRHARIEEGDYIELDIDNGTVDTSRIDVIAFRYEKNVSTGVETADIVVIKGTATANTPVVPDVTSGDIDGGDLVAEIPLYEVLIDGITLTSCTNKFEVSGTIDNKLSDLNNSVNDKFDVVNASIAALQPVDTGWVEVTPNEYISHYGSSYSLRARRINKTVEIRGELTNELIYGIATGDGESTTPVTIDLATLDSQFRPSRRIYEVRQGSGINRFALVINTNGVLRLERYGTTEQATSLPKDSWFTIHSFYFVD
ncbi:MAG: hypothetical protein ACI4D0_03445 [Lachnospira sp.]